MTVFENIKTKNVDELAEWLSEHCMFDTAPWLDWWDENYCNKCEPEIGHMTVFGKELECECAWCEFNNHKCKFFQEMDEIPDNKQIVKMWLLSEYESEVE